MQDAVSGCAVVESKEPVYVVLHWIWYSLLVDGSVYGYEAIGVGQARLWDVDAVAAELNVLEDVELVVVVVVVLLLLHDHELTFNLKQLIASHMGVAYTHSHCQRLCRSSQGLRRCCDRDYGSGLCWPFYRCSFGLSRCGDNLLCGSLHLEG